MTIRERIADWISGGALTSTRKTADTLDVMVGDMGRDLVRARKRALEYHMAEDRLRIRLNAIADATKDGKSGTAVKIHRMAMEGLE